MGVFKAMQFITCFIAIRFHNACVQKKYDDLSTVCEISSEYGSKIGCYHGMMNQVRVSLRYIEK